jgi:hypothetical protein
MIIFQTAGSGDASGFRFDALLLGDRAQVTTFSDNDYVHRLNRTLQSEMRAVQAYQSAGDHQPDTGALEAHQRAGRELVQLVIANRGIPEDRTALSLGLTRRFIQIATRVPSRIGARVTLNTLHRLETHLLDSYETLIKMAPSRDLGVLSDLLRETERRAEALAESD